MKLFRLGDHTRNFLLCESPIDYEDPSRDLLHKTKTEIDKCPLSKWEEAKKYFNEYEYIYTSSKKDLNVANIIPVSRSYFKLWEMIQEFQLLKSDIYVACLAEGPGGFIHCLNDYSIKYEHIVHRFFGITLYSKDRRIPYWNQSIVKNKKVILSYGKDKTGDLYKLDNVKEFVKQTGEHKCHLVTADGGFDYSQDYNQQECSSYKLFYSEILIALQIQKMGGHFVLKVFDLFSYASVQLIYILYLCYSIVEIYKPSTSRLSNSEKYIVCSGFQGCPPDMIENLNQQFDTCESLRLTIPESFLEEIQTYNRLFTQTQVDKIKFILKKYQHCDMRKPEKTQIQKAKQWCQTYDLPINYKSIYFR